LATGLARRRRQVRAGGAQCDRQPGKLEAQLAIAQVVVGQLLGQGSQVSLPSTQGGQDGG